MGRADISKLAIAKPYTYEIAEGIISGVNPIRQSGYNADNAATYETVWNSSTAYSYPTAADTLDVVSDSTADDSAGTGARTLYIEGLDADYVEQSETIIMDGTTPVETANEYIRLFYARCVTVGTGGVNAGIITIADVTSSTTLALILAGEGATAQAVWTVPANKEAIFIGWTFGEMAGKATTFAIFARPYGESWHINRVQVIKNQTMYEIISVPFRFAAKTDIEVRAKSSAASGITVASFDGYYL